MSSEQESVNSEQFSWRDVPYLFANEKFYMKADSIDFLENSTDKIAGYEVGAFYGMSGAVVVAVANECTLIARPISDMSDEEQEKWDSYPFKNEIDAFLYLLSIGVYPFDQSHFETGEVIAIYENGEGK